MKYQTISLKQFYPAKGAIYYVAIATVIFSHVNITWYFDVWRYHVFARKLTWYFIGVYIIIVCILSTSVTNNNLLSSQNEMPMLNFFPWFLTCFIYKLPSHSMSYEAPHSICTCMLHTKFVFNSLEKVFLMSLTRCDMTW